MAGNLAQLNNYLQNVLLITDPDICQALNQQGLQSFDNFLGLTDDDIGEICTNVQKPGGVIDNPLHDEENPVPWVPPTLPNPGLLIGHMYEK